MSRLGSQKKRELLSVSMVYVNMRRKMSHCSRKVKYEKRHGEIERHDKIFLPLF